MHFSFSISGLALFTHVCRKAAFPFLSLRRPAGMRPESGGGVMA